jgi:ribosomal-protein-alanine N-acetyltransferase
MQYDQVTLRRTEKSDLDFLFQFQLDPEGNFLAAFMPTDANNKEAYVKKYSKFLTDLTINMQTILIEDIIVGSIAKFEIESNAEITYWIDRHLWGRGIGSSALKAFLSIENMRPIFARVAFDNFGSQKILEKSGFLKVGTDKGYANARRTEIEEFIYKLG